MLRKHYYYTHGRAYNLKFTLYSKSIALDWAINKMRFKVRNICRVVAMQFVISTIEIY